MTTHNTHQNQSDVDASVVEHTPAPEATVDPSASMPLLAKESDDLAALPSSEQPPLAQADSESPSAPSFQNEELITTTRNDVHEPSADNLTQAEGAPTEDAETLSSTLAAPEELDPLLPTTEIASEPALAEQASPVEEGIGSADQTELQPAEAAPVLEVFSVVEPADDALANNDLPAGQDAAPLSTTPVSQIQETVPEEASFPYASILSFAEPKPEEVRSFSDFIEEFRQSEASQEAYVDFSLLAPSLPENDLPSEIFSSSTPASQSAPAFSEEIKIAAEQARGEEYPLEQQPDFQVAGPVSVPEEQSLPVAEPELPAPTPITRVSPLLRPASRLRLPRHSTRHHREETLQETPQTTTTGTSTSAEASAASPSLSAPVQLPPAESPVEPAPEQPRPARRYRFDRPATNNATTTNTRSSSPTQNGSLPAVTRQDESREKEPTQSRGNALPLGTPPRQENLHQEIPAPQNEAATPAPTKTNNVEHAQPLPEQPVHKQTAPEPVNSETASTGDHTPEQNENGRRRHHPERSQKEHQVANTASIVPPQPPVAEIVVPAEIMPAEPVSPEDLPPLEYAELQKANPRRRRRHRNGPAGNGVNEAQGTPEAPAAQIPLPPVVPIPAPIENVAGETPAALNAQGSPFSIVSGYTVSQMNQGNEVTGPFMGPEPSPARGSVVSRDGRTTRAEMQRTPAYPPAVRSTTHEGGVSSSSLNHLANVVSQSIQQSIQLQTDRMVTEMRRANQAPTSVSVSLPPFPSTERVGVFVDVANLLYSARTLRIAVDFGKLLDFLRGNRRLVRAHAYCPTSPQAGDEQMFLQAVKGLGYRITTKNYKTFSSGAKKADLDLDLCMDVVRLVDGRAVDCIVLVSGDSDFMPMLDYCSDHGVRVEVAAFDEAMSATLRQSCDLFVNLSMLEEIRS